jgi:prepilin-type N-terminal cleavage/methylation domain-containing protein
MCRIESRNRRQSRATSAFTLLEVLVALTILSAGILAVASAFNSSQRASTRAARLQEASELAQNQLELAVVKSGTALQPAQGVAGLFTWSIEYTNKPEGLVLASATVKWTDRGSPEQFQVSQLFHPQE